MAANEKPGPWQEWKAKHPRWHQLLVLGLESIAGLLIVGLIWLFTADGWSLWSANREKVRDLVLIIVGIAGVPFVIWREYSTHRAAKAAERQADTAARQAGIAAERHEKQTEADRERRITDTFIKAVELLGSDKLEARLGAIYTLEDIASQSKRHHWPIIETLTAYVRTRSPAQPKTLNFSQLNQRRSPEEAVSAYEVAVAEGTAKSTKITTRDPSKQVAPDIQAVLTVMVRRIIDHEEDNQHIDLSNSNLDGADLQGCVLIKAKLSGTKIRLANLTKVSLNEANLGGADLSRTNLIGADLTSTSLRYTEMHAANLEEAKLIRANLTFAKLIRSNLRNAKLNDAILRRTDLHWAHLEGADLRGVRLYKTNLAKANLSEAQLDKVKLEKAYFCQTTMPDGTLNNRDCPPEEALPSLSETPPAPN